MLVEWSEWYPTEHHTCEVTLSPAENTGMSRKGRALKRYDVTANGKKLGYVESKDVTLYRKVGRMSNPSGNAVRWSWNLSAPWSEAYKTWGSGEDTREKALQGLCANAKRAGLI